jgi:outer membrane protein
MTKFINYVVLIFAALIIHSAAANAQAQKFGHINSAELIQSMPETKSADSALAKYRKSLEDQLKTMTAEYQTKLQTYQTQAETMEPAIRKIKEKELDDLGTRIQDFQQTAQESIQKKKEELYGPVLKKADAAVKAVAKEKAYSYIFDTNGGIVLYAPDGDDILPLVKAKLGIK